MVVCINVIFPLHYHFCSDSDQRKPADAGCHVRLSSEQKSSPTPWRWSLEKWQPVHAKARLHTWAGMMLWARDRASGTQDVRADSGLFVVTGRWIDGNRCCLFLSCLPLPITSAVCALVYVSRVCVCATHFNFPFLSTKLETCACDTTFSTLFQLSC